MKRWCALLLCLWIAGCAVLQGAAPPGREIFRDELFGPAPPPPDDGALFGVTPAMRHYLAERIQPQVRRLGPQAALIDALYTDGELRLEYDAAHTRGAAEAFAAGKGNCLSLVIMTAAFAQEMGLRVRFQEVLGPPAVEHSGELTFLVGHVNLALGSGPGFMRSAEPERRWLVVDFVPGQDLQRQRTRTIDERRVRAMYMNNRAAEEIARGSVREAYWWLRAGYAQDPTLANLYNTLGIVYRRRGALAEAERALRVALAMEPGNSHVTANLAGVLRDSGRAVDPVLAAGPGPTAAEPPASTASRFEPARRALASGQLEQALRMLQGELGLTPRSAELHYWLAMTYARAGDATRTRWHLERATEYSPAGKQRTQFAGKLERLKAGASPGNPVLR